MDLHEIEERVKNIDDRTARIEQILPTLATKNDLKGFPTKDDPKGFATKDDLKAFATKDDLKAFATKDDLKAFPTRDEVHQAIKKEGELTRQHFNAVAERIETSIKVIAEGHKALEAAIQTSQAEINSTLAKHDRRIMKLEVDSRKRR